MYKGFKNYNMFPILEIGTKMPSTNLCSTEDRNSSTAFSIPFCWSLLTVKLFLLLRSKSSFNKLIN